MRKGSGRQILNQILYELTKKPIQDEDLNDASEKLRTGLLLLGGTPETKYELVDKVKWATEKEDEYDDCLELTGKKVIAKQGIATVNGTVFISDFIETIWEDDIIKKRISNLYPNWTEKDYEAVFLTVWLLSIRSQMFSDLLSVETEENLGIDDWVSALTKKLDFYRKERKE